MEVVTRESSPSSLVLRKTGIFCSIGNIILYESIKVGLPIEQNPPGERTAAEWSDPPQAKNPVSQDSYLNFRLQRKER